MTRHPQELQPWQIALLGFILLSQSIFLFVDARKRGRNPWFWGIWGLIQFPVPLLTYWLIIRKSLRRKKQHPKHNGLETEEK